MGFIRQGQFIRYVPESMRRKSRAVQTDKQNETIDPHQAWGNNSQWMSTETKALLRRLHTMSPNANVKLSVPKVSAAITHQITCDGLSVWDHGYNAISYDVKKSDQINSAFAMVCACLLTYGQIEHMMLSFARSLEKREISIHTFGFHTNNALNCHELLLEEDFGELNRHIPANLKTQDWIKLLDGSADLT